MLKNQNIICICTINWDFLWARKQYLMNILVKQGNKVLFVEPTYSLMVKFKGACLRGEKIKPKIRAQMRKINDNLYILTPSLFLPLGRFSLIKKYNYSSIISTVKKYQLKLKFKNPILWIYPPWAVEAIGKFDEKLIIYDCVDEHSVYPGTDRQFILEQEERLVSKADIVFVTAQGLLDKRKKINANTFFIPNGVDSEHFAKAQKEETEIPDDIKNIKHPVIGFIGGIASWIDMDLIYYLARVRQNWSVVMIGPIDRTIDLYMFKNIRNVHFIGRKRLEQLPNYLKGFDVCISPFKLNKLTKTVNPLKVYEYLAAGKPVVSVDMPEIQFLNGIIEIAGNREEFTRLIEKALKEDSVDKIKERQKIMQDFSWEVLVSKMSENIEKYL